LSNAVDDDDDGLVKTRVKNGEGRRKFSSHEYFVAFSSDVYS
jgi:hypothetical protein